MEKVTKAKRVAPFQVFDMITIDMKAIKTTTMDRRIAGSPDRRIAGSPDRRIGPTCACVSTMTGAVWRQLL